MQDADKTELKAYKALNELDDSWSVRWTYEYLDGGTAREGDFLILGPDGRLLVLEVKKRGRVYVSTGFSDGMDGNIEDDSIQLQKQKDGVIAAMREQLARGAADQELPFICPALFSGEGNGFAPRTPQNPIAHIQGEYQLRNLANHWSNLTEGGAHAKHPEHCRNLFHAVYGDSTVAAEAKFLRSTDRLILDRITADMTLLDGLRGNQQILIRGGAGSGKTWMAGHLAGDLAKEGMKVLFLCYNKALGNELTQDLSRVPGVKGGAGSIIVHTWESLADWLTHKLSKEAKARVRPPEQRDGTYYEVTLPELMFEAVCEDEFDPPFDALVVDEAQDQDIGWWPIYYALMQDGPKSPIGIFYDPAQRPAFRCKNGGFDIHAVAKDLSQPAHFHIRGTRRYTRPIFDYLRSLQSAESSKFVDDMSDERNLLAGPEVIEIGDLASIDAAKVEAGKLLSGWLKSGLLDASDVLLLTRHDPFSEKRRWFIHGAPFATKSIVPADDLDARSMEKVRVTSFHKAKGLDAKAVIMLDTLPWADLRPGDREGYWIAASRARQLLAVLTMRG